MNEIDHVHHKEVTKSWSARDWFEHLVYSHGHPLPTLSGKSLIWLINEHSLDHRTRDKRVMLTISQIETIVSDAMDDYLSVYLDSCCGYSELEGKDTAARVAAEKIYERLLK